MTMFFRIHHLADPKQGAYFSYTSDEIQEPTAHPAPHLDTLLVLEYRNRAGKHAFDARCGFYGFASLSQFRRWFYMDEWLDKLSAEGYVISVFDHDDVIVGYTQAIALGDFDGQPIATVKCMDWAQLMQYDMLA